MWPLRDDGTSPWGDLAKMLGDEANRKARAQQQKAEEDRRRALDEYSAALNGVWQPQQRVVAVSGTPWQKEGLFHCLARKQAERAEVTEADKSMLSELGISW